MTVKVAEPPLDAGYRPAEPAASRYSHIHHAACDTIRNKRNKAHKPNLPVLKKVFFFKLGVVFNLAAML